MSLCESKGSGSVGVLQQKRGPICVEWHIDDYFSYTEKDKCLQSPNFFVSDETHWCLHLHPYALIDKKPYVSFYLKKITPPDKKLDVTFQLGMKKPNGAVFHTLDCNHSFEKIDIRHGSSKFLLSSELSKAKDTVASDGVLRVFCFIRFVDNTVTETAFGTHSAKSLKILTKNFKGLYLGGRLSDVTIKVKNRDFQAHKSVLAARSTVFAAMFEHDMVEKRTNNVDITDCDPESFQDFLLFVYIGKLENVLPSNVFGLYETANKYDVKGLQEECLQLMKQNLSIDTFGDTIVFAVAFKELDLVKFTTDFFIKNVEKILPTTMWQSFMAVNSYLANELFMKLHNIKPVTEK